MSTGRGRVGVAVALAVAMALTGCGGDDGRDDGSAEGTEPSSTASRTPTGADGGGSRGGGAGADRTGSPSGGEEQPPSPTPAPDETGTGTGTGGGESDSDASASDVEACFDGRCDLTVSEPMTVRMDGRLGVSDLRITKITEDTVVLQSSGAGTFLSSSVGEGSTGGLNGLGFRVKSLRGGTAVLEFFPRA
ncbi:hypothetical protein ACWD4G_16300 [Streptomyces sp. NPDC002643]